MHTRRNALLACLAAVTVVWLWSAQERPRASAAASGPAAATAVRSPVAAREARGERSAGAAAGAGAPAGLGDTRASAPGSGASRQTARGSSMRESAASVGARSAAPRDRAGAASSGRTVEAPFDLDDVRARLRARRSEAPRPRAPERNPFEFAPAAPVRLAGGAARGAAPAPAQVMPPTVPPPPQLTLSGVAETRQGDQVVRTAIISGMGQLFFAKPGDRLANTFMVSIVGPDIVELREVVTGRVIRLTLR